MHSTITNSVLNSPCFAWHPYGKLVLFKTELVIGSHKGLDLISGLMHNEGSKRGLSVCLFLHLRIHDPFAMKTVGHEAFPHIWCCNLILRQDRPNTLLGPSWLLMKWHHRNGINVTFQVVFWLKGSCILNSKCTSI